MQKQIEISQTEATAMVDSVEVAIHVLQTEHNKVVEEIDNYWDPATLRTAIQDLQMIRVAYLLLARPGKVNTVSNNGFLTSLDAPVTHAPLSGSCDDPTCFPCDCH